MSYEIKDILTYKMWEMYPNLPIDNTNMIVKKIEGLFDNSKLNVCNLVQVAKTIINVFLDSQLYKQSDSTDITGLFSAFVIQQIEKFNSIVESVSEMSNLATEIRNKFSVDLLNVFHTASCFDSNVNICRNSLELVMLIQEVNNDRSI